MASNTNCCFYEFKIYWKRHPSLSWIQVNIVNIYLININTFHFSNVTKTEDEVDRKKCVKFADGVVPGEGTSPSGGEELMSPPPITQKLPKEKRFTKTKKPKKTKMPIKKKIKVYKIL